MTSDPLNHIEELSTLSVPRFAPRLKPTPIPGANWNDAPLFCLKLNDEWVSHVLGVLAALDQPDTWLGTPEQIYAARQQVNQIMVAFMSACTDCEVQFRIEDCDLQWRGGEDEEWISLGNICGDDGAQGPPGETGERGETGDTGPAGPQGPAGVDGDDCDCTDYNHVPTPDNPPDTDDDGTACNIAAGIAAYIRAKSREALAAGNSTVDRVIAVGALAASIVAAAWTGGAAWPLVIQASGILIATLIDADGAAQDAMLDDDSFWNEMACSIYCVIKPNKDITPELQADIATAIRGTTYTSGSYDAPFYYGVAADFFGALPNEVVRANVAVGALISYDCSGCDECSDETCSIDLWYSGIVANGGTFYPYAETSRSGNQIVVPSFDRGDGTQEVSITTKLADVCCGFHVTTEPAIDLLLGQFYVPCGTTADYEHLVSLGITPTTTPMNTYQIVKGSTPFVATFTFDVP